MNYAILNDGKTSMQLAWALRALWLFNLWLVWCTYGISWEAALALLLGAATLTLTVVLASFALAAAHASPRPDLHRLSAAAHLKLWLTEAWACAMCFLVRQVFPRKLGRNAGPTAPRSDHLPVLLIHGFTCNEAAMAPLWKRLSDKGFQAFTHTMQPLYGSIEAYRDGIDARIAEVLRLSGAPQVNVVVHSMGGLAMRAWARSNSDHATRVAKLVTIGTPHQGTALAQFGAGVNARQMELQADWWRNLPPVSTLPFPVVSIYSHDDNIVAPQHSSEVPGAKWLAVSGVGHLRLLTSTLVFGYLLEELIQSSVSKASA